METKSIPNNRPKLMNIIQRSAVTSQATTQMKNQTFVNVLSHQVLVPGKQSVVTSNNTTNRITVTNGTAVLPSGANSGSIILNNLKSGNQTPTKIVKSFPQNWTLSPSITTRAGSSGTVVTSSSVQASSQHLLQILNSPPNVRKNLTITTTPSPNKDDPKQIPRSSVDVPNNGVVQFICKTDGKVIHLTPISNAMIQQQQQSGSHVVMSQSNATQNIILNSLLKKPTTSTKEVDPNDSEDDPTPRSMYEENYANFIRTGPKNSTTGNISQKPISVVVSGASGTQFLQQIVGTSTGNSLILQNNKLVATSSLPKFNQAFGKTVTTYQPGSSHNQQDVKSDIKKEIGDKKHIIVQTSSSSTTQLAQNFLIHNKGRTQFLQTKSDSPGIKFITSQAGGTVSEAGQNTALVTPLRISVPLIPRGAGQNIMQTRIVRPIIQLAPNLLKTDGQNVVITTTPRQRFMPGQNIRLENLLLAAQQQQQQQQSAQTSNQIQSNQQAKNVDNSTLEQLREFDMVLEQVKERSTSVPPSTQSQQSTTQSPARSNQVTVINHVKSVANHPQRVQEIIYTTASGAQVLQKVNLAFLQQNKQSLGTPLVVVTNYNQNQTVSPALSVTSQLSSPTRSISSGKSANTTPSKVNQIIVNKPKSMSSPGSASSSSKTMTPKSSPLPKPIQKPQEDEQTVQRIYDILAEYAEQLRNSPDLNNKPAPRRRSNPPTNPATPSTKKKKSNKRYHGKF